MEFAEVKDKAARRDFHNLPFLIYRNDKNWIPQIKQEIEEVFDKQRNICFGHGEAIRWVLYNEKKKPIGRVAAFINKNTCNTFSQPTGGMGFFECINDKSAAFALFDKCRAWLEERGMQAMDGPVNFGEKDRFWGLLAEGDSTPSIYTMNHNPPYYKQFFEDYGFTNFYEQIVYYRNAIEPPNTRLVKLAQRVTGDPNYRFETLNKRYSAKYAEDFRTIYNKAWKEERTDFEELTKERALALMKKLKPILDEDTNWFAYYKNEPVGVFICIPELNTIMKYVNGNFNMWGKLKFLWYFKTKGCRTMLGIVFGIAPEFQGKGIEAAIFKELGNRVQMKKSYDHVLISWIGNFNQKMMHLLTALLDAVPYKKFITYRFIFKP